MATKLNIRALPATGQLELSWEAKAGRTYHVQKSTDLSIWVDFAGPFEGEDALFVLQIHKSLAGEFFKLVVSVPEGYSVPAYTVTAFSGQYVLLSWEDMGPPVLEYHYEVERDGQNVFTTRDTSYRDNAVSSGKTYKYEVRFFS